MDDSPKLYDLAYRNPLLSLQIIIWKWLARSQGYLFGASQKHLNEWGGIPGNRIFPCHTKTGRVESPKSF